MGKDKEEFGEREYLELFCRLFGVERKKKVTDMAAALYVSFIIQTKEKRQPLKKRETYQQAVEMFPGIFGIKVPLFELVGSKHSYDFREGSVSEKIKEAFETNEHPLSTAAEMSKKDKKTWKIEDGSKLYEIDDAIRLYVYEEQKPDKDRKVTSLNQYRFDSPNNPLYYLLSEGYFAEILNVVPEKLLPSEKVKAYTTLSPLLIYEMNKDKLGVWCEKLAGLVDKESVFERARDIAEKLDQDYYKAGFKNHFGVDGNYKHDKSYIYTIHHHRNFISNKIWELILSYKDKLSDKRKMSIRAKTTSPEVYLKKLSFFENIKKELGDKSIEFAVFFDKKEGGGDDYAKFKREFLDKELVTFENIDKSWIPFCRSWCFSLGSTKSKPDVIVGVKVQRLELPKEPRKYPYRQYTSDIYINSRPAYQKLMDTDDLFLKAPY